MKTQEKKSQRSLIDPGFIVGHAQPTASLDAADDASSAARTRVRVRCNEMFGAGAIGFLKCAFKGRALREGKKILGRIKVILARLIDHPNEVTSHSGCIG